MSIVYVFHSTLLVILFINSSTRISNAKQILSGESRKDHQTSSYFPEVLTDRFYDWFEYPSRKSANAKVSIREGVPVERPLLIGSFNIQTLGKGKFSDANIMSIIEKIILRYDVILIMEVMTKDDRYTENLLRNINSLTPAGTFYNMTIGERQPATLEHCVYFYRTNRVTVQSYESYDHPTGEFYRKPLVVVFNSPTLRDMTRFIAIGLHVKPSQAVQEINALAELYYFLKDKYNIQDVLLMGDFNADCTYVKESDWEDIDLWTRSEFTWVIGNHVDTTTNYRSCALDRFVYAGENMNEGVIMTSAQIFNFQEAFDLTTSETRAISDHWPIELKIRGKLSPTAEKHLRSDVCFTVKDSRPTNATKEAIFKAAIAASFTVLATQDGGFRLFNKTATENDMKNALEKIREMLPGVISLEQYHGVLYKLEHRSLNDDSSYSDIEKPVYNIEVIQQYNSSIVVVCRRTSIN